ncbi:MAG: hypothetical protein J0G29_02370 [Alphaproteobacteria bacterium]|nr:hypothetical protein [Alphaproteobacteria bacterium]OJV45461.1 MAG: hypothetical protein BGO28_05030 [Alphaproteobacteria bacterium 43-37]
MLPISSTHLFAMNAAMSASQSLLGYMQARQNAAAQRAHNAMIEAINQQNALSAYDTYYNNLQALESRLSEEYMTTGQKLVLSQKQALEVAGHARASAAASGFGGVSINNMMRQIAGQFSASDRTARKNMDNQAIQSYRNALGMHHETLSKANNVIPTTPVQKPSPWAHMLGLGGDLMRTYTSLQIAKGSIR